MLHHQACKGYSKRLSSVCEEAYKFATVLHDGGDAVAACALAAATQGKRTFARASTHPGIVVGHVGQFINGIQLLQLLK